MADFASLAYPEVGANVGHMATWLARTNADNRGGADRDARKAKLSTRGRGASNVDGATERDPMRMRMLAGARGIAAGD